jgi:exopolysaccharide biosynthesis polyprenyl glycosylphosphotransferase
VEAHTHAIPHLEQPRLLQPAVRQPARTRPRRRNADRRDSAYRYALAVADVASAAVALLVCIKLLGDDELSVAFFLAAPLIVIAGKVQGLYDRDELLIRKTTVDEAGPLFQLATTYALVLSLLDGAIIDGALGKTQVLVLWAALFLCTLTARGAARYLVRRNVPTERLLFIGESRAYERLRSKLECDDTNAQLVGRMSLQRINHHPQSRATDTSELRELVAWTQADRLVIDPHLLPPDDMLDLVRAAKDAGARVSLLPSVLDVVGTSVAFDELHGMTLIGVPRFGLSASSRRVKRAFDLVGTSIGLVAVAPVLAVIALAVRVDSRGPVFFRQTRIGRDGRPFEIWKFRTMVPDAEALKNGLREHCDAAGGLFKMTEDPRVTRVGRLLRRTSLDELPQLFNVVSGDMSLVGPRPLITDEDERITGSDRQRLHLTPGMTGPWQLLGSTRVPLGEMVKLDYLYVAGWSLWADLKILVRTVAVVAGMRGV